MYVGGLHRNPTNKTEENNLTPKLTFKATKIKFKNQNALLKIIFSLQGFTLLKNTLIAYFHPQSPSAL